MGGRFGLPVHGARPSPVVRLVGMKKAAQGLRGFQV
jgi:hypothetical protein